MEEEIIKAKAIECWNVIRQMGGAIAMSWGISKKYYREYNGMATLMLKVCGFIHSGWVYISLNEGADLYEVTLMDESHQPVDGKQPVKDLFFDQLVDVIDRMVERGNMTEQEYSTQVTKSLACL